MNGSTRSYDPKVGRVRFHRGRGRGRSRGGSRARPIAAILVGFGLASAGAGGAAADRPTPRLAVAYDAAAPDDFDRSFDYFPPIPPRADDAAPLGTASTSRDHDARTGPPALVVFVHGRFWSERQPDDLVLGGLVKGVLQSGHAALVVRHRPVSSADWPAPARDVAKGVARAIALARDEAEGLDPDRVFLVGHSSGAQLALLVALDADWLAAEGEAPDAIAGVAALSGILDLAPEAVGSPEEEAYYAAAFPKAAIRQRASPIERLAGKRPAILVMTAARDVPGYARMAERFVARARAEGTGAVERFVATGRDHFTILDLARPGGMRHVLEFLASDPRAGELPEGWAIASTWRSPPFTTEGFHARYAKLRRSHEADALFLEVLNRPFPTTDGAPPRLRAKRYEAIDLVALVEAQQGGPVPDGAWLEITNVRGERAWFEVARLRALRPRVVIGLDGERNLFEATDLYHTRRRYSWTDASERRVVMARPLGAFLFFPDEQPRPAESLPLIGRYALVPASFTIHETDPRRPLADLPALERASLLERHHCVSCHRFRDVGGRAFHLRARDAAAVGGHALPLERYPPVVLRRFLFEQRAVAEEVGATPVTFGPGEAKALEALVAAERARRGLSAWERPERDRDRDADLRLGR